MIVTPACSEDLEEIAALVNSAYRGETSRAGWTSEADLLGGQRTDAATLRVDLAAAPGAALLVLRETTRGAILASVWLQAGGAGKYYLGMLNVQPTRQADGLGRLLLGEAERVAAAAGASAVQLTVIEQRESLIAWYERRGYRRTGEVKPFPYEDRRVGEPLRGDLRLVVMEMDLSPR